MAFADELKKLDASSLQRLARAKVDPHGRLIFTTEAMRDMGITVDNSIVLFEARDGHLGATVAQKGAKDGFILKRNGPYLYIAFSWYLQLIGLDYKKQKIVYDVLKTDEEMEGRTLWKLERRIVKKEAKQLPVTKASEI